MMKKEKIKVYIYTRVSTAMQIDGYSLDAQKSRMKAYAEFNDYEIVGEYEDAGKSGKSIEGRVEFNRMMEDIKSGKDGVSYVLVFKLSRFGRNAADVLSTLQVMQDFGVNLICVEDGIDSSKDAGKLMISVLSAVAEIERENIRVQTMEGRIQKAREGKWNGGFAPYGYKLENGQLFINEEEAAAIRVIFDQYVHTDMGANGLAKYLATHGIHKIQRQNGKNPLYQNLYNLDVNAFEAALCKAIEFVRDSILVITKFKGNSRNANKIFHSKYQILSMISTTFKEMYAGADYTHFSDTWQERKQKIARNLVQYYVYDTKIKNTCSILILQKLRASIVSLKVTNLSGWICRMKNRKISPSFENITPITARRDLIN